MYTPTHSRTSTSPFFRYAAGIGRSRPRQSLGSAAVAIELRRAGRSGLSRVADSPAAGHLRAAVRWAGRSRLSMFAASAATVGVLGSAGFALGTAPWGQAFASVTNTVHGGSQPTSGQFNAALFGATGGIKTGTGTSGASTRLDAARSAPDNAGAVAAHQAARSAAAAARQHPAKPAAAKPAAAKPAAAKQAAARHAAKPHAAAAPAKPYTIYDSVTPGALPSGKPAAVYVNGAYAASSSQVSGHHSVLWIDINGSDPKANVLDVEPGDATPAGAAHWVQKRLTAEPNSVAIVYTMLSDWQQVKSDVAHLPSSMQSKVRYWIADPTGSPHIVPGSSATQWYWGSSYDITSANANFTN